MKLLPPDFRSPDFLREHALQVMAFYDGRCVDPSGGFYQFFKDDGTVYDATTRHLVSSARFVTTHAWAARHFPDHPQAASWRDAARHGLRFLDDVHRDPGSGAYAWLLRWEGGRKTVLDDTHRSYGLAFVLLAQAHALQAGIAEAADGLRRVDALLEDAFWEPAHGLYADEARADGTLTAYRGQNANMHTCEAMLAAHEATGDDRYLERAASIAERVTVGLAAATGAGGLIWEHYDADWRPDRNYHRGDTSDLFRPWGYQPGHLAEWAKLLLSLERARPGHPGNEDLVHRARSLFACAVDHGWDRQHDGMVYAFAADDAPGHEGRYVVCDAHKMHWVQAETIAAAAVLAERTLEGGYWDWYDRLWAYCWDHFVDHRHGAWYRILSPENAKITDEKSPAGKVDYHTLGACYEVLASRARDEALVARGGAEVD